MTRSGELEDRRLRVSLLHGYRHHIVFTQSRRNEWRRRKNQKQKTELRLRNLCASAPFLRL